MGTGFKQTFFQRNIQMANEEKKNAQHHYSLRKSNQNHNAIPLLLHIPKMAKIKKIITVLVQMWRKNTLYVAGGSIK